MRKFLLTLIAIFLWLYFAAAGVVLTVNDYYMVEDPDTNMTLWDEFMLDVNNIIGSSPFYYFGEVEETTPPEEEAPDSEIPDGETPEGEAPEGETPEGETPDGGTPDVEIPEGETPGGDGTLTE